MLKNKGAWLTVFGMILMFLVLAGCQPGGQQDGIHVMFEEKPRINGDGVFWHGQTIGTVSGIQVGNNAITKVTVRLDNPFKQHAGHNWAFYVHRGRLMADRLSITGESVATGDHVCGFSSKAALNWFKIKTLLNNRVSKAKRRAQSLERRFG